MEAIVKDEELDADATGGITAEIVKARDDDIIDESSLVKEKPFIIETEELQVGPISESFLANIEARQRKNQFQNEHAMTSHGVMTSQGMMTSQGVMTSQQNGPQIHPTQTTITPVITPHVYSAVGHPVATAGHHPVVGQFGISPFHQQQTPFQTHRHGIDPQAYIQGQGRLHHNQQQIAHYHPYASSAGGQQQAQLHVGQHQQGQQQHQQYAQQQYQQQYQQYYWQQYQMQQQWIQYQRQMRRHSRYLERRESRESRRIRDSMERPFTFIQLKPIRFEPNERKNDKDQELIQDSKHDFDQSELAKLEKMLPPPRGRSERRDSLDILADCAASLQTYGNV